VSNTNSYAFKLKRGKNKLQIHGGAEKKTHGGAENKTLGTGPRANHGGEEGERVFFILIMGFLGKIKIMVA